MNQPLVSVIIPVYKTEDYLDECVQSVLSQDYPALEIILVDDGSPDNCPKLCDDYAARYENIRVIHHANCGLGLSRNAGLKIARGEYIYFLDSDDCLDGPKSLYNLVECAKEEHADIVVGCFRRFWGNEISEINHHHLHGGDYTQTVDFRFKGFYMYGHLAYDWGKLYRRSFLIENNILCRDYPFTQDKAHNMMCLAHDPIYAFLDTSVHLYRVNQSSITFRYKPDFIPVWTAIVKDFEEFLADRHMDNRFPDLTSLHVFYGMFFLVKQELQFAPHGILAARKALRDYAKNPQVKRGLSTLAFKNCLKGAHAGSWKPVIRMASLLVALHGYLPAVLGISLLRKLQIDTQITRRRYRSSPR